jgi:hypothetical protein
VVVQAQSSVLAQVDFPVAGGAGIGDAGLLGLGGGDEAEGVGRFGQIGCRSMSPKRGWRIEWLVQEEA